MSPRQSDGARYARVFRMVRDGLDWDALEMDEQVTAVLDAYQADLRRFPPDEKTGASNNTVYYEVPR